MSSGPEKTIEKWLTVAPELRLRQLDHLENDGLNIQCINSSDFVIGRQINFNGPVTIVNSAIESTDGEKIIIRDKVLSKAAAAEVQKIASVPDIDRGQLKRPALDAKFIFALVCVGFLLAAGIALSVTLKTPPTEGKLTRCIQVSDDLCIYLRIDWGNLTFEPLKPPLRYVIISQTDGSLCFDVETCLKTVERLHRNNSGCNFFVGSDGNVYEGRGWKWNNALVSPAAGTSLEICFVGDYNENYPTHPQVTAAKALIRLAVDEGHVAKDYILRFADFQELVRDSAINPSRVRCARITYHGKAQKMSSENQLARHPAAQPDSDVDVNVQCIHSSEFVIGRTTNFNAPVMIINGPDDVKTPKEKIIIRDKVLSRSTGETKEGQFRTWKGHFSFMKLSKLRWVPAVVCVGISIAVVVGLGVFLTTEPDNGTNNSHVFYSKSDWVGKSAKSFIAMKLPVPYAVVSHTVTPRCSSLTLCAPHIRNMQSYHMSKNFADIAYNFLLDSAGNIYEGRGWTKRNSLGGFINGRNIDVALMGDYSDNIEPSEEMMDGLVYLLEFGTERGLLSENYSLIAANATIPTLSPGKNVYRIISAWPHFDPDPKAHVSYYED